jgi:osmotically-inducible protein OsmY
MDSIVASDPKDVELEALISRTFRAKGHDIRTTVDGGTVTLFGVVDDFDTKRFIDPEAQGIAGVRRLNSRIRVAQ